MPCEPAIVFDDVLELICLVSTSQMDAGHIPSYVNTHDGSYFPCVTMSRRRGWYYIISSVSISSHAYLRR